MNQIACCDWLPERARWSYLAHSGLPAVSREENFSKSVPKSQIINPLLTKLFRSRLLDIGLVHFLGVNLFFYFFYLIFFILNFKHIHKVEKKCLQTRGKKIKNRHNSNTFDKGLLLKSLTEKLKIIVHVFTNAYTSISYNFDQTSSISSVHKDAKKELG